MSIIKNLIKFRSNTLILSIVWGIAVLLLASASYVYAVWNPPTADPTGDNADPPINTGSNTQLKTGALGIGSNINLLSSSGRIGLGTLSPASPIHLGYNSSGVNIITFGDPAGSPGPHGLDLLNDDGTLGIGLYYRTNPQTLFIENSAGTQSVAFASGLADCSPSTTPGALTVGETNSTNICIDENEILARNNGSGSTLHLNNDGGGNVHVGNAASADLIIPRGGLCVDSDGSCSTTPGEVNLASIDGTDSTGTYIEINHSVDVNGTFNVDLGGSAFEFHGTSGSTQRLGTFRGQGNDGSYEYVEFESGNSRAGIMLWDGSWSGCTAGRFCIKGDSHQLALGSNASGNSNIPGDEIAFLVGSATRFEMASHCNDSALHGAEWNDWIGIDGTNEWIQFHIGSSAGSCNGERFRIASNGVFAHAYFYFSDSRLKENIKPLESSLDKILQLQGVRYNWKETGEVSVGLIAQDVQKVFPELIASKLDEDTGEEFLNLDYGHLAGPIIEAIKEQQKQIEELETRIEELENK